LRRKRHWWGRQGKKLSRNDIQNTWPPKWNGLDQSEWTSAFTSISGVLLAFSVLPLVTFSWSPRLLELLQSSETHGVLEEAPGS
jgi:hypothetical protein